MCVCVCGGGGDRDNVVYVLAIFDKVVALFIMKVFTILKNPTWHFRM